MVKIVNKCSVKVEGVGDSERETMKNSKQWDDVLKLCLISKVRPQACMQQAWREEQRWRGCLVWRACLRRDSY